MSVVEGQVYVGKDGRRLRVVGRAGYRRVWIENLMTGRKTKVQTRRLENTGHRGFALFDWEQAPCPRCDDPGVLEEEGVRCGNEACKVNAIGGFYQDPPGCQCDDESCVDARGENGDG